MKWDASDRFHQWPGKNVDLTDALEPIVLAETQLADLACGGIIGGKPEMVARRPVHIIAATASLGPGMIRLAAASSEGADIKKLGADA